MENQNSTQQRNVICYFSEDKFLKSHLCNLCISPEFTLDSKFSAPPYSSLCIEGSKLHRRLWQMAMKNSQLLFPIVNANASTLTTPLNFNHQNLGIKRQDSKDALCRHPCIWKDQRRGKGKAMKKQAWLFTIGGVLRQRYIHISGMTLLYSRSTYQYERPPSFMQHETLSGEQGQVMKYDIPTRTLDQTFFFQMSNKNR